MQGDVFFGFHNSIAGRRGYTGALEYAELLGTSAVQIFAKSPRSWRTRKLKAGEVEAFRDTLAIGSVRRTAVHASYLVNLGAEGELWEKSVFSLADDIEKAALLGIDYVVVHPGSGRIERIRAGALKALSLAPTGPLLLLENVAGGGSKKGKTFEELAEIIADTELAICFDTSHAFAAGYPLHNNPSAVISELDLVIGLDKIPLIHLNDSQGSFASGIDHHANLGEGAIGEALASLVTDERFGGKTFIMETPKSADAMNLKKFKKWVGLT